jgi:hypothetical protein
MAEQQGRYPLTRAVAFLAKAHGITKAVAHEILGRVGSREWHHVGKYANRVYYYETDLDRWDPDDDELWLDIIDLCLAMQAKSRRAS